MVLAACSPRTGEPLADDSLRFPEYVDPPSARDTLAPARDGTPGDTVPPRIAPEQARVTADVEIFPGTPPVLQAGAKVRDAQGRLASAGTFCLLGLHMHNRTNSRPVWTSVGRGEICASGQHPEAVTSGGFPANPGNPQRFRVVDVLGDSIPPGRYSFSALVRFGGDTLEVNAGAAQLSRDTLPPLEGPEALAQLRYRAGTWVEDGTLPHLHTRVAMTNVGPRRVNVSSSGCGTRIRAYHTHERAGHPVWDSARKGEACLPALRLHLLEPGETEEQFGHRLPLLEFLGDSLPDGRYYFAVSTAWLEPPSPEGRRLRKDTVHLPAGDAELVRPRGPLPSRATVGAWTVSAHTRLISAEPHMLLITLAVRNTGREPAIFPGATSFGCAAFEVYRTPVVQEDPYRDMQKLERARAWSPQGCMIRLEPVRLGPGESHTYGARIAGRTVLGDSLPPGRYHFLTFFQVPGPDRQLERVTLSAGDARLRR